MRTLIAYASKHGFTKMCAEALAKKLGGEADLCDLGKRRPDISEYDRIIIGGPVYMGRIHKPVRHFCEKNLAALENKEIGLFICGANEGETEKQFASSYPARLLDRAAAKEFFGGELDPDKHTLILRAIVKSIIEKKPVKTGMRTESIERMAMIFKRG